jgi:hypothetical protein
MPLEILSKQETVFSLAVFFVGENKSLVERGTFLGGKYK